MPPEIQNPHMNHKKQFQAAIKAKVIRKVIQKGQSEHKPINSETTKKVVEENTTKVV